MKIKKKHQQTTHANIPEQLQSNKQIHCSCDGNCGNAHDHVGLPCEEIVIFNPSMPEKPCNMFLNTHCAPCANAIKKQLIPNHIKTCEICTANLHINNPLQLTQIPNANYTNTINKNPTTPLPISTPFEPEHAPPNTKRKYNFSDTDSTPTHENPPKKSTALNHGNYLNCQ